MTEPISHLHQVWRKNICDFIIKYGVDLKKWGRAPNVEQFRTIIPLLIKYVYGQADNKKHKEKGTWINTPDDWPKGVFFGDPNNGKIKPKKDELAIMAKHLMQRFIEKEKGETANKPHAHVSRVPISTTSTHLLDHARSHERHYDISTSNTTLPERYPVQEGELNPNVVTVDKQFQKASTLETIAGQPSMSVEVVDDEDLDKCHKGAGLMQEGLYSLNKRGKFSHLEFTDMMELLKDLKDKLQICMSGSSPAEVAKNTKAKDFDNSKKSEVFEEKQLRCPVQETEGKSNSMRNVGQFGNLSDLIADKPVVLNGLPVDRIYKFCRGVMQLRPSQDKRHLNKSKNHLKREGSVVENSKQREESFALAFEHLKTQRKKLNAISKPDTEEKNCIAIHPNPAVVSQQAQDNFTCSDLRDLNLTFFKDSESGMVNDNPSSGIQCQEEMETVHSPMQTFTTATAEGMDNMQACFTNQEQDILLMDDDAIDQGFLADLAMEVEVETDLDGSFLAALEHTDLVSYTDPEAHYNTGHGPSLMQSPLPTAVEEANNNPDPYSSGFLKMMKPN